MTKSMLLISVILLMAISFRVATIQTEQRFAATCVAPFQKMHDAGVMVGFVDVATNQGQMVDPLEIADHVCHGPE
jgi:hypothetical protein